MRTILHVDLDAFFAAVEQRDHPELRGLPVIVGGGGPNQRGVVSAASYEARTFGVHSAMPLRTAGRLCPQGVFLPVDGRRYQAASREVMAILRRFTPQVQPISIDEAFLDVTGSRALFGDGETIARSIKSAVRDEVGLTASVGVACTKLVAKIASDLRKPDGLVVVAPGDEAAFLAPLPISRLWGVGERTAAALRDFGVTTIGDLAALPREPLVQRFGKHGASLVDRAKGIDPDPVATGDPAKSIGHEHTFDTDTADREVIERTLLGMADGVAWRVRAAGLKAGTVTIKLRDSRFVTMTRQTSLEVPADLTEPIYEAALTLLRRELHGQRIRLVGVTASNFREREQLELFGVPDPRRHQTAEALDRIRRKYGERAVTRARLVRAALPAPFERDPMTAVEHRGGLRRARGTDMVDDAGHARPPSERARAGAGGAREADGDVGPDIDPEEGGDVDGRAAIEADEDVDGAAGSPSGGDDPVDVEWRDSV
jgi:DNA polymerase IV